MSWLNGVNDTRRPDQRRGSSPGTIRPGIPSERSGFERHGDGNVAIGGVGVAASANSVDEAAICCIGFLIAGLLNHTELTYETYQTNREDFTQRVGIRFGVG